VPAASSAARGAPHGLEDDDGAGCHRDLKNVADPVDAARVPDADGAGDHVPDQRADDAGDDRQPDREVLPTSRTSRASAPMIRPAMMIQMIWNMKPSLPRVGPTAVGEAWYEAGQYRLGPRFPV